jgi:hypothetical protein
MIVFRYFSYISKIGKKGMAERVNLDANSPGEGQRSQITLRLNAAKSLISLPFAAALPPGQRPARRT